MAQYHHFYWDCPCQECEDMLKEALDQILAIEGLEEYLRQKRIGRHKTKRENHREKGVICRSCGHEMFWHNGFWHCNRCHSKY